MSLQGCLAASLALNTAGHAAAGLVATASGGEHMSYTLWRIRMAQARGCGCLQSAVCRHSPQSGTQLACPPALAVARAACAADRARCLRT